MRPGAGRGGAVAMADELSGERVAVPATDGAERVELDEPWQALVEAGAEPTLVGHAAGTITAFDHIEPGSTRTVDVPLADADPDGYDALVLPGGVVDGDFVRADPDAVAFVSALTTSRNSDDLPAFTEAVVEQFAGD